MVPMSGGSRGSRHDECRDPRCDRRRCNALGHGRDRLQPHLLKAPQERKLHDEGCGSGSPKEPGQRDAQERPHDLGIELPARAIGELAPGGPTAIGFL